MKRTYLSHNKKKKNLADWPEMSLGRNKGQKDLGLSQADFTLETFFVFIIFVFISLQLLFLLQQTKL